jgi:hypothetical protein
MIIYPISGHKFYDSFLFRFPFQESVRDLLSSYLDRFSSLAGPVITCGPVLNWLELDNRGHRLVPVL